MMNEQHEVIVIGAGQAGLALGYFLHVAKRRFVLLDGAGRVGTSWRARYDSLRLFTPAKRDALPGLPFPGDPERYPTKDEVADYLEAYARTFDLPVRLGTAVDRISRRDGMFRVEASSGTFFARQVVVATGPFGTPRTPTFARDLDAAVVQRHSSAYRHPDELPFGRVLVVGGGNSGAQIAEELARERDVTVALGQRQPHLPQRVLGRDVFDWLWDSPLFDATVDSPLGRWLSRRDPVVGTDLRSLARRGRLRLAGRAVGASGRKVIFADGRRLAVDAVVWATGFRPEYGWLDVPLLLGADGRPRQSEAATNVPGLFFLGRSWQRTRGSALLGGVGRDAERLARHLDGRARLFEARA